MLIYLSLHHGAPLTSFINASVSDEITIKSLIFLPLGKKELCAARGCTWSLAALEGRSYIFGAFGRTFPFNYDIETPALAMASAHFSHPWDSCRGRRHNVCLATALVGNGRNIHTFPVLVYERNCCVVKDWTVCVLCLALMGRPYISVAW